MSAYPRTARFPNSSNSSPTPRRDRGRFRDIAKECSGCGLQHTAEDWTLLPYVGDQEWPPSRTVELRNCCCGSTLALEVESCR